MNEKQKKRLPANDKNWLSFLKSEWLDPFVFFTFICFSTSFVFYIMATQFQRIYDQFDILYAIPIITKFMLSWKKAILVPWVIWALCLTTLLLAKRFIRKENQKTRSLQILFYCSLLQFGLCGMAVLTYSNPFHKWMLYGYWPEMTAKSDRPLGKLPQLVGTIVTISGEVLKHPEENTQSANANRQILLKVLTIDGKACTNAISLEFELAAGIKENIETPQIGDKFTYVGYELIRQEGIKYGALKYIEDSQPKPSVSIRHKFIILATKK